MREPPKPLNKQTLMANPALAVLLVRRAREVKVQMRSTAPAFPD